MYLAYIANVDELKGMETVLKKGNNLKTNKHKIKFILL